MTKNKRGRLDDAFAKRAKLYDAALESWRSDCKTAAHRRGKKNAVSTSIYDRMNEYAAVAAAEWTPT